ncbi:MAG: hypothetical protein J3K34DRAFT_8402 [Monoraphidium minutum]|nr:MAG: hypothetical protein J3K34DRAFT_8402 [Monoraphidium minutum]
MAWSLSDKERAATAARIAANIATLAFFRGTEVQDAAAAEAAASIERKAYTAAGVAARTTTGDRPAAEIASGYVRKLAELTLEAVKDGALGAAAAPAAGGGEEHDLFGSRDFLDAESAEKVLAPLLAAGAAIKKVRFSTKSFGRDAAAVAARAIKAVSHCLEHADMSDVIAGRAEDEALESLRIMSAALAATKLRRLNLSDNALGEKGVRAAAEAFVRQEGLEFLSLQNVGCSVHACKAVSELLVHTAALSGLHLFNNMSGDEGAGFIADVLARSPAMADFKMASSRVGPAGGTALARGLGAGRCLVRLDLSDNPMTPEVAPALAAALKQQPRLRHLNLNDTSLTDEGVEVVCAVLVGAAPELQELELALNEITPQGARAVAAALAGKAQLVRLNLRENELESAGAAAVARALPGLPALQTLDLAANQVGKAGALAVARGLAAGGRSSFSKLILDENFFDDDAAEAVRDALGGGLAGCELSVEELDPEGAEEEEEEDEAMDDGGADELAAALERGAKI